MRNLFKVGLIVGALAAIPASLAQGVFWKYVQRWTPRLASHESRVFSCAQPQPFDEIAMDDWVCGATGPIVRVTWWGVLSSPAQARRPFYVAIYGSQPTACLPNQQALLYSTCVVPNYIRFRGVDCEGRRVYQMSAIFPTAAPPFTQQQGVHYWLQISEADAQSIRPQLEDFRWSSHRYIKNCPAISAPPLTQPILDACDGEPEDLAFGLASRDIHGVIVGVRGPLQLSLFDPDTGDLVEQLVVEPGDDGAYTVNPEAPDGAYGLELSAPGMLPVRRTVMLANGMCTQIDFADVALGDLDGDGSVSINDLALMLANFGRSVLP